MLANSPTILRNLIVQMRIVMETVEMTSVVNHCDSDGRTPLHLAASLGHKVSRSLSLHPHPLFLSLSLSFNLKHSLICMRVSYKESANMISYYMAHKKSLLVQSLVTE